MVGRVIGWSKLAAALCAFAFTGTAPAQGAPITLSVDLTDAPRRILHASESMPVVPGPLTLVYPKWNPGDHAPTGQISNFAGLFVAANGKPIKWERDRVDMFAIHLTVPEGVAKLEIKMDFLATGSSLDSPAGRSTTANLAIFNWQSLLLYPADSDARRVLLTPSVTVPEGWKLGTALEKSGAVKGSTTVFKTVSLEKLVDSPVLAGRYFREIALAPEITPKHYLDMAADAPEELEISQEHIDAFDRLVRETGPLYKSRHYGVYRFLVTLSDEIVHDGLEHHESSDDRIPARSFVEDPMFTLGGDLLPHEFTHSWNGKYRRPVGLATSNYQKPMEGDLLWVYEGLTQYLGDVLAARSGIWTADQYKDRLATIAAEYDTRPGRSWRNVQDTATGAQILYDTGGGWDNWRLSTDFYEEGELIWLDVDTTIRKMTNGKKSIGDFVAKFHGLGGDTEPKVVTYKFEDVVDGLNGVVANDWATFLRERVDSNDPHAPLGGLANGGYRLTYSDKPNSWSVMEDSQRGSVEFWYSLGLHVAASGVVSDVLKGGVADKAGFGPGMKIIAVNSRAFTPALLRQAVRDARGAGPAVEVIVENTGYFKVLHLEYHGGERYPALKRVDGAPDRLDNILKPEAN